MSQCARHRAAAIYQNSVKSAMPSAVPRKLEDPLGELRPTSRFRIGICQISAHERKRPLASGGSRSRTIEQLTYQRAAPSLRAGVTAVHREVEMVRAHWLSVAAVAALG